MALEFNGIDDSVEIPDSKSLDIHQSITITAWIKAGSPKGGIILEKEGAYGLLLGDNLTIKWIIWGDEWDTKIKISPNVWYQIALVYDFSAQRRLVYLDGQVMAEKETKIPIPISNEPLIMGKLFSGIIDDVSIWSSRLSEDNIRSIVKCGFERF